MSRSAREAPSLSTIPRALLAYVGERGGDAALIAERLGFSSEALANDETLATPTSLCDLIEAAGDALGDPHLSLRLPTELALARYGRAELAARASATVKDALERLARYAELVFPGVVAALEATDDGARFVARCPSHPRGIGRAAHEYVLAYAIAIVRDGAGSKLAAKDVWFAHARPPDLAPLARFFGTDALDFGRETNGFTLDAAALDARMQSGDPRLLATAEELANAALGRAPASQTMRARVAAHVEEELANGASVQSIARALHMSARTLQRRLDEEGVSFSELVDEVREELATRWLADRALSLTEIAFRLGFADLATFSRAFKRWTGKPPGTWRRA